MEPGSPDGTGADVSALLRLAIDHHRAGRLAPAQDAYARVLAADPQHADALHLSGIAAFHGRSPGAARHRLRSALAVRPAFADACNSLGNLLSDQGRLDDAIVAYRRAIVLRDGYADALGNLGVAYQAQGRYDDAAAAYADALAADPTLTGPRHNLGILHRARGRLTEAAACFFEVLRAVPQHAPAWRFLALTLRALRHGDAEAALRRALADAPADRELAFELGRLLGDLGRHAEAEAVLLPAVAASPSDTLLRFALGRARHGLRRLTEAAEDYRQALAGDPTLAGAWNNLGVALLDLDRYGDAVAALRVAVAIDPADPVAFNNLGSGYDGHDRPADARRAYAHALILRPDYGKALNNLANVRDAGVDRRRETRLRRAAIASQPDHIDAYVNLGATLRELDRPQEAEALLRRARCLDPLSADALTGLGLTWQLLGRPVDAELAHRAALVLTPNHGDAQANLGMLLWSALRVGEADRALTRSLALAPALASARLNFALVSLAEGRLPEGWENYRWRFRAKGYDDRPVPAPEWMGGPLPSGRLLVWGEQGIGDEILFASCVPEVMRRVAAGAVGSVIVECDRRLVSLLARSFPGAEVVASEGGAEGWGTARPPVCDAHSPTGALPRLFRRSLSDFGGDVPWLKPDPARVAFWGERVTALGGGLRIGIAWRSQMMTHERRGAYVTLDDFAPVFALAGVRFVNLQYGDCAAELEAAETRFGVRIHRWDDLNLKDDFEGTAALTVNLHLVITPAMSAGELAGALGVPVWRFGHRDWTQLGSGVRPWYPSHRLFQPRPGEGLVDVLGRIARSLTALCRPIPQTTAQTTPQPKAESTAPAVQPAPLPDVEPIVAAAIERYRGGDRDGAEHLCRSALDQRPDHAVALHLLGVLLMRRGDPEAAAPVLRRAGQSDPGNAAARAALADVWQALGRPEAANAALRDALAAQPDGAVHWVNRAALLRKLARPEEAEGCARRAIRLRPDLGVAHGHIGDLRGEQGDQTGALASHRRALALEPARSDALVAVATLLRDADRVAEAADGLRRAAVAAPDSPAAWTMLGDLYDRMGRGVVAREAQERAIALAPDLAQAHANLGIHWSRQGRAEEAIAASLRAIAIDPGFAVARYNLALRLLEAGAIRPGWGEHEWRFGTPQFRGQERRLAARAWRGENATTARLLVWREQGVGDELLFSSCYPDVLRRAGRLVVECDRRLVTLLARSIPGATVRPVTIDPRDVDIQIAAGSLPRLLRGDLRRFPDRATWLVPDPARAALWRERLAALGPGLAVGISWRSQIVSGERRTAYTTLDQWGPLFAVPGLVFVNLQYGDCEAELAEAEARFGVRIHRWSDLDLKDDFEGTAALTSNLDLVVCPATAVGELAGGLGVPVWRIGRPDWTQLGSGVRPWFPSHRLFQPRPGEDLGDVLTHIARALRAIMPAPQPLSPLAAATRDDPDALLERAAELHREGRRDEATPLYEQVLRARPDDAVALHLSGLLLHQDGRSEAGAARIARALEFLPDYPAAQSSLGTVLLALDRPRPAVARFRRALAVQPDFAAALTNLGNALDAAGMLEAAAAAHRRAIVADPDLTEALDNHGAVLTRLGRAVEAAALHRAALRRNPLSAAAWMNLGIARREVGRWDDAGHALRRALAVEPGSPDAAANFARLSRDRGAVADAERWSARALTVDPDNAGASFTMGLLRLARGDLEAGWAGYDARFRARELSSAARALDLPPWRGEDLTGRRLLVWREQGIGDQILFGTTLPEVIGKADAVVVECDPRLVSLFARSFPDAMVTPSPADPAEPCPGGDRQVGLGSLGRWLRGRLTDFPDRRAVLVADPVRAAAWRDRLAALGPGLRVGIAWRSGLMTAERSAAYAALEHWGPVFAVPGLHLVTLQYGDCEAEVTAAERRFGVTIHRWPDLDLKDDLDGVAALISGLDLVLSPASSVAEMAGALGVPVWRFAPAPDWTSLGTAVRPWYPAMRLIHAPPGEPAAGALPRIAALLRRLQS